MCGNLKNTVIYRVNYNSTYFINTKKFVYIPEMWNKNLSIYFVTSLKS